MRIPIEIFNEIIIYTNEARLIPDFKQYLFDSTIKRLLQDVSIKEIIMNNDIKLLEYIEETDKEFYDTGLDDINNHEWEILPKETRLSVDMIIKYGYHIYRGIDYVYRNYYFDDNELKKLISNSEVIDVDEILKYNQVSDEILHFLLEYGCWFSDLYRYQKYISEDFIGLYIEDFDDQEIEDLIIYRYLTEDLFRDYFYKFNEHHISCILDYELDNIIAETHDIVNWSFLQFKEKYVNVLHWIKEISSYHQYFLELRIRHKRKQLLKTRLIIGEIKSPFNRNMKKIIQNVIKYNNISKTNTIINNNILEFVYRHNIINVDISKNTHKILKTSLLSKFTNEYKYVRSLTKYSNQDTADLFSIYLTSNENYYYCTFE